eukprot:TRINITY_DN76835_c0_g1_i1.p1 TRINITY_DN76835_c0_g1~~TRINITY_DN76835_c0_g1_i1.p1  ORF type:complete len:475 (-),score=89.55 TRINITY_DN76835_c0_g1_i1:112-1341(-)
MGTPSAAPRADDAASASQSVLPHELAVMANKARNVFGSSQVEAAAPRKQEVAEESWRGRVWSILLAPGEETTIEARFANDGAHYFVSMQDRGPGINVTATLVNTSGEHDLLKDCGQSFHGQTPVCHGEALLRLHLHNQWARVSERKVEVKMFLFQAGSLIGNHSFVQGALLDWMTTLVNETFLEKSDVKLKADRLKVVKVERTMHTGLWNRYVKRRKEIVDHLAKDSGAGIKGSATKVDTLTDKYVPLPLSEAANEHWFFHGTSAASVFSIAEHGFVDNHKMAHGLAFGAGCYFTECSSKADVYATPATWRDSVEARGLCCILLCRVALGRARKLDSDFHIDKAQLKIDMQSGQFHSVLADRQRLFNSYREFVTNAAQAYPEFIVWYQRDYKTALETWKAQTWGGDLFG